MILRNMLLLCMDVIVNCCGIYVVIVFFFLILLMFLRFIYIMCYCEVILKQVFKVKYNLYEMFFSDGGIKVWKEFGVLFDFFNMFVWWQEYVVNRWSFS